MRRRPPLVKGDVCRFNKKGRRMYKDMRNATMTVMEEPKGDSTEAWTYVRVMCVYTGRRGVRQTHQKVFKRQYLWKTSYNRETGANAYPDIITDFRHTKPKATSAWAASRKDYPCRCPDDSFRINGCTCGGY